MRANSESLSCWADRLMPAVRARIHRKRRVDSVAGDEILSDVLLKLTQFSAKPGTTFEDIQGVLPVVVRNAEIDWSRREKSRKRCAPHGAMDHILGGVFTDGFEDLTSVLSPSDQSLLHAKFVENRTDIQISADERCSRSCVTRRVQHVLQKLRKWLNVSPDMVVGTLHKELE